MKDNWDLSDDPKREDSETATRGKIFLDLGKLRKCSLFLVGRELLQ